MILYGQIKDTFLYRLKFKIYNYVFLIICCSIDISRGSDNTNSISRAKARNKRSRENLLQYCSTPDICRLMIQRGCKPGMSFIKQNWD